MSIGTLICKSHHILFNLYFMLELMISALLNYVFIYAGPIHVL